MSPALKSPRPASPASPPPLRRPGQPRRPPAPRGAISCSLHRAPGQIPFCKGSRAASRKLKTHPGRLRGYSHDRIRSGRRESSPRLSLRPTALPGKTQLFLADRGPYLRRPSGPTAPRGRGGPGARAPARPSRPRSGQGASGNAGSGWRGCAPPPPAALRPLRVPSAPPRSSEPQTRSTFRGPPGRMLGASPRSAP